MVDLWYVDITYVFHPYSSQYIEGFYIWDASGTINVEMKRLRPAQMKGHTTIFLLSICGCIALYGLEHIFREGFSEASTTTPSAPSFAQRATGGLPWCLGFIEWRDTMLNLGCHRATCHRSSMSNEPRQTATHFFDGWSFSFWIAMTLLPCFSGLDNGIFFSKYILEDSWRGQFYMASHNGQAYPRSVAKRRSSRPMSGSPRVDLIHTQILTQP